MLIVLVFGARCLMGQHREGRHASCCCVTVAAIAFSFIHINNVADPFTGIMKKPGRSRISYGTTGVRATVGTDNHGVVGMVVCGNRRSKLSS